MFTNSNFKTTLEFQKEPWVSLLSQNTVETFKGYSEIIVGEIIIVKSPDQDFVTCCHSAQDLYAA